MTNSENLKKQYNGILKENGLKIRIIKVIISKNGEERAVMHCKEHGSSDSWGNPWLPQLIKLKVAKGCIKCSGKYKFAEEELIEDVNNNVFHDGKHKILKIIDYKNRYSKCIVKCKEHGLSNEWGNPWLPNTKDLKAGYGCPKCYGNYLPTKEEVTEEVNMFLKGTGLTLIDIPNYKNRSSACHISCEIHGNGWEMKRRWTPIIKTLRSDHGCPLCSFETNKLKTLLKNPEQHNKERYLYFLKFTKEDKNEVFYKIGVNNSKNINMRYRKGLLEKAKLCIEVIEHIKTSNMSALMTEFYILKKYKDNKSYQRRLKTGGLEGATECFSKNILRGTSLKRLIKESLINQDSIISAL